MNTLSRALTAQFLTGTAAYAALRAHWSALMRSERRHELRAAHHLLYLALIGRDWRKGFTPPTNPRKLANGAFEGWILFRALQALHSRVAEGWLLEPFDGMVTPPMLQQVRRLLPLPSPYAHRPEQFSGGTFPFAAYKLPESMLGTAAEEEPTDD